MKPRARRRRLLIVLAGALSILVAGAIAQGAYRAPVPLGRPPTGTLTIYSSFALSGSSRATSVSMVNAIRLALEESGGRAGPFQIEYQSLDDSDPSSQSWNAALETANASRAAADSTAVAYIGTSNAGAARVALPILNQAKLLMLSPSSRAPDLTKDPSAASRYYPSGIRTFFRVIPSELAQATAAAHWFLELGRKHIFVIDDGTAYGTAIAGAFATVARRDGLDVVARQTAARTEEFAAVAQRAAASGGDGVLYTGLVDSHAADLVRQLRSVDPRLTILGLDGIADEEFLKQAGAAAEGTYAMFAGIPIDQYVGAQRAWLERYRARFGADPDPYAAYGYEGARVLLAAIEMAGEHATDRDRMLRTLRDVGRDYDGLFGKWSFDPDGDTTAVTHTGVVAKLGRWAFARILN